MAALPSERVYLGFWTDHTRGLVLGATITVKSATANVIVALLSILILFTGAYLWDLIAFTWYLLGTRKDPQDGIYHQQRSLLRNITSPGSLAFELTKVWWYWRKTGTRPTFRHVSTIVLATLCSTGFLAAGILSSLVVSTDQINVLATSNYCGGALPREDYQPGQQVDFAIETGETFRDYYWTATEQAIAYSRTCTNGSDSDPACAIYYKRRLPYRFEYVPSPFTQPSLINSQQGISMDTGFLDSCDDFGINSKQSERIKFRQRIVCTPLNVSEYEAVGPMPNEFSMGLRNTAPMPDELLYQWSLGYDPATGEAVPTRALSNYNANLTYGVSLGSNGFYQPFTNLAPVPKLQVENADTYMISLGMSRMYFNQPSDDPVFGAHRIETWDYGDGINHTYYLLDRIMSWIGCTQQYQFCASDKCTAPAGLNVSLLAALDLPKSPRQNATFWAFNQALGWFSRDLSIVGSGALSDKVLVSKKFAEGASIAIPDNQWEVEVQDWVSIVLAGLQKYVAERAAGPGIASRNLDALTTLPPTTQDRAVCHSQMMKAPNGFSNVSVLGLGIVVAVAGVVISLSFTLSNSIKFLHRRGRFQAVTGPMTQWDQDGLLQLHRKAFEGYGVGGWQGDDQSVPVQPQALFFADISTLMSAVKIKIQPPPTASTQTP